MIPITPITAAHADHNAAVVHDVQHYMRPGTLQLTPPPLSLYVHLPWCLKKCPYCDFNSHESAQGSDVLQAQTHQRYTDALVADLESALPLIWGRTVHSIFIGGGTPSLFAPAAIDQLLGALRARLRLAADCEITLEANPGTFETNRFRAYRSAGITRLSIGVQSFHDAHLQALGRVHDRAQAIAAVQEAASVFETFNLDIMYALPGQDMAQLEADMAMALGFAPPHISIYHLTVEPNTYFAKYPPTLPHEDLAYDMLDRITEITQGTGLERYEISAYGKPGHHCRHNLNYWQFGDYLGLGAGAHSKLSFAHRVVRQVRFRDPARYMTQALSGHAVAHIDEVARKDLPFEFMLNALRLRQGFTLSDFVERTGLPTSTLDGMLAQAQSRGLLESVHSASPAPEFTHTLIRPALFRPTPLGFDFLSDLQAIFLPPT
jgi:putative oxygen-independent coproporphyrinogen III oxidase